jgi:hypothetical protein
MRISTALAVVALFLLPATTGVAQEPTLVPPTVIEPVDGTHVPAGTHVNFAVRTFAGDEMLWVHISQSRAVDECGVVDDDVHIYSLDPTSDPAAFRTNTTFYDFEGFWMVTPGTYYWQAYRIEHHFDADGCIETPIQTLVIDQGESKPVVPRTVAPAPGDPFVVKFDFPSPATVTTTLTRGTKTVSTIEKATDPGAVRIKVPTRSLPMARYTLTTNVVSKTTAQSFTFRQTAIVERKPALPRAVTVKPAKPITVAFKFPSPAKVTTTLKKDSKPVLVVKKTTKPGTAKVTVPAKSSSYCGLAAAASCPLPTGKYKLTTKIASKPSGNKFKVNQALTVTSRRG